MRRKKILTGAVCAVLWLLAGCMAMAQNFVYPTPQLFSVSFEGNNANEYIEVKSDLDGSAYSIPHYVASSNTRSPVGYVRNTKPKVTARFTFNCNKPPQQILVRGDVDGQTGVYPQKTVSTGLVIEYPATVAATALPNTVRYFPQYKIDWKVSFNGGSTWLDAGSSVNPLYVTLAFPLAEIPAPTDYLWYQTLLHIGCEKGSGATDIATLLTGVWNYVKNRSVTRAHDNAALQYYGSWACTNTTTGALIKYKDGQCGAWTKFLLDILKIQGFQETGNYWIITPIYGSTGEFGFYVKTWAFAPTGTSGIPDFPFLNRWGSSTFPYNLPNGPYNWISPEVTETAPSPGQNQPSPLSRFNNHQFAKILGEYYDPAYGENYPIQSISLPLPNADGALSAYYIAGLLPPNTFPVDAVRSNPPGIQHNSSGYSY